MAALVALNHCGMRLSLGMRLYVACTLLAPLVSGHAILMDVEGASPRLGISGTRGTGAAITGSASKLRPFTDAAMYADETRCGGVGSNDDPDV